MDCEDEGLDIMQNLVKKMSSSRSGLSLYGAWDVQNLEIFLSTLVSASNKEQLERELRNRNQTSLSYYIVDLCILSTSVPLSPPNVSPLRTGVMSS